jgi:hypothetical protein
MARDASIVWVTGLAHKDPEVLHGMSAIATETTAGLVDTERGEVDRRIYTARAIFERKMELIFGRAWLLGGRPSWRSPRTAAQLAGSSLPFRMADGAARTGTCR